MNQTSVLFNKLDVTNQRQSRASHAKQGSVIQNNATGEQQHIG